jgi:hypothetical protein
LFLTIDNGGMVEDTRGNEGKMKGRKKIHTSERILWTNIFSLCKFFILFRLSSPLL